MFEKAADVYGWKSSWYIWLEKLLVHMVGKAADIYGWKAAGSCYRKTSQQRFYSCRSRKLKMSIYEKKNHILTLSASSSVCLSISSTALIFSSPAFSLVFTSASYFDSWRGRGGMFLPFPYSCLFFKKWAYNYLCSATHQLVVTFVLRWDEM